MKIVQASKSPTPNKVAIVDFVTTTKAGKDVTFADVIAAVPGATRGEVHQVAIDEGWTLADG